MRIALFKPDIPQNTGTSAVFARASNVEAAHYRTGGFSGHPDRHFRRAGMDYLDSGDDYPPRFMVKIQAMA